MEINAHMLATGLMWYLVFLFSTTVHEASHALAAKLGGDLTAFHGGQVTLDPMPHIRREPIGMVLVPLLTFFRLGWMIGWASTPYDPYWAARHPRRAALMSLAGPSSNLLLVILAAVGIKAGIAAGYFVPPASIRFSDFAGLTVAAEPGGFASTLAMLLSITFMLNLLLGCFNLLPLPPMDGSSVITLAMNDRMRDKWNQLIHQPVFSLIGLVVFCIVHSFPMV